MLANISGILALCTAGCGVIVEPSIGFWFLVAALLISTITSATGNKVLAMIATVFGLLSVALVVFLFTGISWQKETVIYLGPIVFIVNTLLILFSKRRNGKKLFGNWKRSRELVG